MIIAACIRPQEKHRSLHELKLNSQRPARRPPARCEHANYEICAAAFAAPIFVDGQLSAT